MSNFRLMNKKKEAENDVHDFFTISFLFINKKKEIKYKKKKI